MALSDPMPPEDRSLSPYTGWTRAHWEALADRMLLAVRPYASDRRALLDLPGPPSKAGRWSDGLEGYARTFLLAAFRLAQGGADDVHNVAEWYASGLSAGTDPSSPERWPTFEEKVQAVVECASVALALHETRPYIWDRLDDRVRQRVVDWMSGLVGIRTWNNNWVWFQNLTQAFLRSVGGPWSSTDLERNFALTDAWYVGDGWYSDGDHDQRSLRNFDYYCGWAMQFYPLWYCRVSGPDTESGLYEKYHERLTRFLADHQHFVAPNGSPILQGRSLTYRYAMVAPFWAGALFDATPLSGGRTRRLASGVVRHFHDAGFLDREGLQPLGWHGAFELMRQPYSGPGSPYWSSKGFAGLVLPASHPAWTAVEEPLEIEERDVALTIPAAGWVLSGTSSDGIVRLTNHRSDHAHPDTLETDDPMYARHAYATHAAPDHGEADAGDPVDSHVALLGPDGRASHRRPFELLRIDDGLAISRHRAHWPLQFSVRPGPWLTTASLSRGPLEIRLARVDPADPTDGAPEGPWWLRFGGYAVTDPGLTNAVRLLTDPAVEGVVERERANPLGRTSFTPWVRTVDPIAYGRVYAALVVLSGEPVDTDVRVDLDDDRIVVVWPDGVQSQAFRLRRTGESLSGSSR